MSSATIWVHQYRIRSNIAYWLTPPSWIQSNDTEVWLKSADRGDTLTSAISSVKHLSLISMAPEWHTHAPNWFYDNSVAVKEVFEKRKKWMNESPFGTHTKRPYRYTYSHPSLSWIIFVAISFLNLDLDWGSWNLDTIKEDFQDGNASFIVFKAELVEIRWNHMHWQVSLLFAEMQKCLNCTVLSVPVIICMIHDFSCLFNNSTNIHFTASNVASHVEIIVQRIVVPWEHGDISSLDAWSAVAIVSFWTRTATLLALLIKRDLWYFVVSHRTMDSIVERIGTFTMPVTWWERKGNGCWEDLLSVITERFEYKFLPYLSCMMNPSSCCIVRTEKWDLGGRNPRWWPALPAW